MQRAPERPNLALPLPPLPVPAPPAVSASADTPTQVSLPLAPSAKAFPQSAPQSCPPADRDGVVRCTIFAGWAGPMELDRAPPRPGDRETALVLLGTLLAAGIFDILRRLLS